MEEKEKANKYPVAGGLFIAVFNASGHDQAVARKAVIERFGVDGWKEVKARKKSGLMEIFNHKPTKETELFAEVIAERVERRLSLARIQSPNQGAE